MTMFKKVFGVVVSLLLTLNAMAYDFMADGIAYNILSNADKTVEVTYQGSYGENYETISAINIPTKVIDATSKIEYDVVRIGDHAFYVASLFSGTLQSISIPSSITTIGEQAFYGCYFVKNLTVDDKNQKYKSIDDVVFTKDGKQLIAYIGGREENTYIIPKGVTTIAKWAFAGGSNNLSTLIIPHTVDKIEDEAFYYQVSPITIYCYADDVPTLGENVFQYTDNLTAIYVPQQLLNSYKAAEQWKDHNIQNGTISLDENSSETATQLSALQDEYVYAELNRSFVADGAWYTLCLPFTLTEEEVEEAFGECELMKLNYSQKQSDDLLYVNFSSVKTIDAGTPYLFRPAENVDNPVFKGVTIDALASTEVAPTDGLVKMTGIYSPTEVPTGKWYMGPNNTLYQPQNTVRSKGFRAYFELAPSLGTQIRARVVMNGQVYADIDMVPADSETTVQKIVENGRIYILRNGERYDVTGIRIN